jgi:Fe-S-cluster containining protein
MSRILSSTPDTPIHIGRNESCPCRSGKKFKNCCLPKGHEYAEFIAPNGKKAIMDTTERHEIYKKINDHIIENKLNEYYQQGICIDTNLGIDYLMTIYRYFDKILEPIHHISSCKKGCSFCCKIIVSTTALEAELIRSFMINKYPNNIIKEIYKKIDANKDNYPQPLKENRRYPEATTGSFQQLDIPCPFLSDESTCTIYDVRPFVCRRYLVFSESEKCKGTADNIVSYNSSSYDDFLQVIDLLSAVTFKNIYYTKHIASWFLKNNFFQKPFKEVNLKI